LKLGQRLQPLRWRPHSRSIKGRLVALFILLALGTTLVFFVGSQRWLKTGWEAFAQPLVVDYAQRLADDIGSPPQPQRAQALAQRLPLAVAIEGPQVQFQTHPERFEVGHRRRDENWRSEGPWRWTVQRADGHRIHFALRAPPDLDKPRFVGWLTLAALLGLTAAAYAAVRRQLKPLQDITAGVQKFGAGDFAQPIPVRRDDELGDLAQRINHMARSLQGMLDAKRALLLAMSHELRSPLTRARVNAELLDDSAERTALMRDLGEMRDLITSLLDGERLASGHSALHTEDTDLVALARESAALHETATAEPIELSLPGQPLVRRVDPTRLRLLLRNLLHNAGTHGNPPGSPADGLPGKTVLFLSLQADGRWALGVRDRGPGVADDQLAHLAQAFYRPDSSRTRASGGVGLGLYLCRLVAQAHGGELRLRQTHPGLEVAMVW
jgi:signal transduction histidine kinase